MENRFPLAAAALLALSAMGPAAAQVVRRSILNGSAPLDRVLTEVARAGFGNAVVVGRGAGATDAFFVLTATAQGGGVLIAVIEPPDSAARPVVLERGNTPAELGVSGVEVTPFLGARDLVDVVVTHRPQVLEMTRTFVTHHIVQAAGSALTLKCDVDGEATSSSSKGVGSTFSDRSVTLESVPGQPMSFMVTVVEKTMRTQDRGPATTSDSTVLTRRYELQPKGTCRVLKLE